MRELTNAALRAQVEALRAENDHLIAENKQLRRDLVRYQTQSVDAVSIDDMRKLANRLLDLQAGGVPCRIHCGQIVHNITGAVLP